MSILEGKVAVVTGATSGIGARIAELFVSEGASVVLAGRRGARGEQLARGLGPAARFIRTDVCVESDVQAMIAYAVAAFGRLDCLINDAGTGSRGTAVAEVNLADFDAEIAVHLRGVLAAMKHAAPIMIEQNSGSIINVASVNGVRAGLGGLCYSIAKAASIHLTKYTALELGEKGIRVNSISPGPVATGIFGKGAGLSPDEADDRTDLAEAGILAVLPKWQAPRRVAMPDDIARAALFLAGDDSRMITGQNLIVDGGICAGWPRAAVRSDIAAFRSAFQNGRATE